jgi:hypothetical protein
LSLAELTAAHFGGGVRPPYKKTSPQEDEEGNKPKSRKELIEELIAKSKQGKVGWLMFLIWGVLAQDTHQYRLELFSCTFLDCI